jgi:acetyl esterase/lipase
MSEAPWRRRFRAARVTLPEWARDNPERLLYSSNATGKYELYAWNRRTDEHRQVTDRVEGTLHGQLDPSGDSIWWFDDERGNERGRWVVEPFAGGAGRVVDPDLPPAYSVGLALARGFAVRGSSDDAGTVVHLVRPGQPPEVLYQHLEDAELGGLSRDETLVAIAHSEHGDSRHPAVRVLDLAGSAVADLWDGPGRGLWPGDWSPVAGDQRLIVEHERNGIARPLLLNAVTGQTVDLAIDLPGEVEASWYPDAAALLLSHDYRGRVELYRLDLATGALERLDVPSGTIFGADVRPDGEVWYSWTTAATAPEVRAGASVLLRAPGEPAPSGVPYSSHLVDGVEVFIAEPAGPRPHPTIFQVHGGPTAHDRDAFSPTVQAWVDHGYAVVLVNYRGSTGYGKAWRDALEGNPGLTELEDVGKARDWVVASGIADPGRVVLAGRSWGGYLTLLGLGTQPERWSLGLAGVPVADYVAAFEDEMEPLKAFDRALFGGTPGERPEFYAERSPITYVERVRVPVFVMAGLNDPRCPIRQIENYVQRLQTLAKPHEVYRYDAGHGSLVVEESIRQTELQIAFAARHLGTPEPT